MSVGVSSELRHERFATEYVKNNGNAAKAAAIVFPDQTKHSQEVTGSRLLNKVEIQEQIKEIYGETRLNFLKSLNRFMKKCDALVEEDCKEAFPMIAKFYGDLAKSIGTDGVPRNVTQINKYALPKR